MCNSLTKVVFLHRDAASSLQFAQPYNYHNYDIIKLKAYFNVVFHLPRASDAKLWCVFWCYPEQTAEQRIDISLIRDARRHEAPLTLCCDVVKQQCHIHIYICVCVYMHSFIDTMGTWQTKCGKSLFSWCRDYIYIYNSLFELFSSYYRLGCTCKRT